MSTGTCAFRRSISLEVHIQISSYCDLAACGCGARPAIHATGVRVFRDEGPSENTHLVSSSRQRATDPPRT